MPKLWTVYMSTIEAKKIHDMQHIFMYHILHLNAGFEDLWAKCQSEECMVRHQKQKTQGGGKLKFTPLCFPLYPPSIIGPCHRISGGWAQSLAQGWNPSCQEIHRKGESWSEGDAFHTRPWLESGFEKWSRSICIVYQLREYFVDTHFSIFWTCSS